MTVANKILKWIKQLWSPCQCNECRYNRGESVSYNSREALKREANKWVKEAKQDAKLLRKLFK